MMKRWNDYSFNPCLAEWARAERARRREMRINRSLTVTTGIALIWLGLTCFGINLF